MPLETGHLFGHLLYPSRPFIFVFFPYFCILTGRLASSTQIHPQTLLSLHKSRRPIRPRPCQRPWCSGSGKSGNPNTFLINLLISFPNSVRLCPLCSSSGDAKPLRYRRGRIWGLSTSPAARFPQFCRPTRSRDAPKAWPWTRTMRAIPSMTTCG